MKPKSVLILWTYPTSYFLASIRELLNHLDRDCVVTLVSKPGNEWYPNLMDNYNLQSIHMVSFKDFEPNDYVNCDLILMSSWNIRKFRVAARLNRDSCKVMAMDNQNVRSTKQVIFLASKIGPLYIRFIADFVFAAGERQRNYASQIGFRKDQIVTGAFSFDDQLFQSQLISNQKNQFCFVGRKVAEKGIDVLITAYQDYRALCADMSIQPWDLVIAGPGKIARNVPSGVKELGYLSPREVAALLLRSRCFVLPSAHEPFGVVLTEASASGCLIIASSSVGAADDLIKENINGFTYPRESSRDLATCLLRITQFTVQQNQDGRIESINRAKQFAPKAWSEKLLQIYAAYTNAKI